MRLDNPQLLGLFVLLLLIPCWGLAAARQRRRKENVVPQGAPPAVFVHLDVDTPGVFASVVDTTGNKAGVPVHVSLKAV